MLANAVPSLLQHVSRLAAKRSVEHQGKPDTGTRELQRHIRLSPLGVCGVEVLQLILRQRRIAVDGPGCRSERLLHQMQFASLELRLCGRAR